MADHAHNIKFGMSGAAVDRGCRQLSATPGSAKSIDRRTFLGGSDARVIVGSDEGALLRRWQEKRGDAQPQDFTRNLLVQLGSATEDLNRRFFEQETNLTVSQAQRFLRHPSADFMGATLDGMVETPPEPSGRQTSYPGDWVTTEG